MSFFSKRKKVLNRIKELFSSIDSDPDWSEDPEGSGNFFLVLNKDVCPDVYKIFHQLQFNEILNPSKLPKFIVNIVLIGQMSGIKPRGTFIENL